MNWKCDKCGSEEVQQEFFVMLPMNSEDGWSRLECLEQVHGNDFFWCVDCDEECSPIRK